MNILNFTTSTLATLLIVGCGGGSGNNTTSSSSDTNTANNTAPATYDGSKASDRTKIQKVEYKIENNTVICNKPGAIVKSNSYGTEGIMCVWYCGAYEGASPIAVYLSFAKENNEWQLSSENTVEGGTSCHN